MATLPILTASAAHAPQQSAKSTPSPRKTKEFDYIPWSEIEPTLNLIKNQLHLAEPQILSIIGYSGTALTTMRARGTVMRHFHFALKGLLADRSGQLQKALTSAAPTGVALSEQETMILMRLCDGARKAQPGRAKDYRDLKKRLTDHLLDLLSEED